MLPPRRIGSWAEDEAARHLLGQGYTLLTRRYKGLGGEIDLVALDGETLVFVEVKFRAKGSFPPEESVDEAKKARILAASASYMEQFAGPIREVRYDLVAIDAKGLRLHRAAFEPE